jgi:hypothetical protein
MAKSSSLPVSANFDKVRKCPVDDFWKLLSSGRSRWVDSGRDEWSRVGARTESLRDMAKDSGRGFPDGDREPSNGENIFSTLCDCGHCFKFL